MAGVFMQIFGGGEREREVKNLNLSLGKTGKT